MKKPRHFNLFCTTAMLIFAGSFPSLALAQDEDGEPNIDPKTNINHPQVVDGHFQFPLLAAASIATDEIGNGRLPQGFREGEAAPIQVLPESAAQRGLDPSWSSMQWAAPNTFSYPRYFEDRMLERHGHQRFGKLQPLASGTRFFATVPMLPYLMTISRPCDRESTLGYYRPGSRTPKMLQRPPFDARATIVETAAIAGGILVFP